MNGQWNFYPVNSEPLEPWQVDLLERERAWESQQTAREASVVLACIVCAALILVGWGIWCLVN